MRVSDFPPAVFDSRRWFVVLGVVLLAACGSGGGGSGSDPSIDVTGHQLLVRWRASASAAAAGFVIHWGTSSGVYTDARDVGTPRPDADGVLTYELDVDFVGEMIFFALTSYDADGNASAFSNEIAATIN